MIEITDIFRNNAKFKTCPKCGNPSIHLYDDFSFICQNCGWEYQDNPGDYLSPMELTDWKAGMWVPNFGKRTSLLIGWQLFENGEEIDSDVIPFDTEEGSLKLWLTLYLIKRGQLANRELRFQLYDQRELEVER